MSQPSTISVVISWQYRVMHSIKFFISSNQSAFLFVLLETNMRMAKFTTVIIGLLLVHFHGRAQGNFWGACTQSDFTNEATAMATDAQNNVYTAGYITGESAFGPNVTFNSALGNGDIYVAKYSAQGTLLWVKKYGGSFSDRAYDIKVDGQGNILVTGQFFGTVNFDGNTVQSVNNSKDIFLIKMSPTGAVLWALSEGGPMAENVYGLAVDSQNNIILTGQFQGTAQIGGQTFTSIVNPNLGTPSYDLFVSKYDTNGNALWALNGAAPYEDRGMALVTDSQNNIYVSGQFSDTLQFAGQTINNMGYNVGFLAKLSPAGTLLWFNRLTGGMVLPYDLAINTQDEVHVCGDFLGSLIHQTSFGNQTLTNAFSKKVFAIKVSATGQIIWQRALGSDSEISARGIAIDNLGKVYIGGHFRCALTELQEQNTALFNSVGFRDIYLWTLGADGTTIATKQMGGKKDDYCYDLAINNQNRLFFCGSFINDLNLAQNSSSNVTITQSSFNFSFGQNIGFLMEYFRLPGDESANSFVLSGFDAESNDYNFFLNQSTDSLFGYISHLDTLVFCDSGLIYYQPLTHYYAGPDYNYLWSSGSSNDSIWILQPDEYSVIVERTDQCVSDDDTIYVLIHTTPSIPLISDDIVQHASVSLMSSFCGASSILKFNICPPDTFNIWFEPLLPDETISVVWPQGLGEYANTGQNPYWMDGVYQVTVANENCSITRCFRIVHDEILPKDIEPVAVFHDGEVVSDTIEVCLLEYVFINILDTLTNPSLFWLEYASTPVVSESFVITCNGTNYGFNHLFNPIMEEYHYSVYFSPDQTGWYAINYEVITGYDNTCGIDTLYTQIIDSVYVIVNPLPLASTTLSLSSLLCPDGSVFVTTSNTFPNFTWSGPSVDWVSSGSDSAQVSAVGFYFYGGSITDSVTGCTELYNFPIQVIEKTPPTISTIPPDAIICPYDSVLMSVPPIYLDYNWTGPGGTMLSIENTHLDAEQGYYYCTVLDDEGCYLTTPPTEIMEYSTPYLMVEPDVFICGSGEVTITALIMGTGSVNWLPPLSGTALSVTVDQAGWYSAEMTQCGITIIDSVQIIDGSFSVTLTASDTLICFNTSVVIQGSYPQAYYEWNNGMTGSPMIEVNESGFYFATVLNDFGCEAISDTVYIEYINSSAPPNNASYDICYAQDLTLTTNLGIPALWFDSNYQLIAESVSLTQLFSENTTIYVAFPQDFCPLTYGTHLINFEPPLGFDLFIAGPTLICATDNAVYSLNYQGDVNWSLNGQAIGTGSEIILSGEQIGSTNTISAFISNACSDTTIILNIGTYQTPQINLSNFDTILCPNTWFALPVSASDLELDVYYYGTWYSYEGDELYFVEPTTIYLAGIDDNGCFADTVAYNVSIFSSNFAIEPIYLPSCAPDSLILTTIYSDSNTVWTNGANQIVADTATYYFSSWEVSQIYASVVDNNGCAQTDSILIYVGSPALYDIPNDTTVCIGAYVYTSVFVDVINGQLMHNFLDSMEIVGNTTVEILIDNGICPTSLSYQVNAVVCPTDFPNVITPNGDGVNEYFLIPNAHLEPDNHLVIMNRWGNVIYEANGYTNNFNGIGVTEGVYFYVYTADAKNRKDQKMNGVLHIIK
jgi:gliding motility-associated-like protein